MRLLLVHNRYQNAGGEDAVFEAEKSLLCERRHDVAEFVRDNTTLVDVNPLRAATTAVWSRDTVRDLRTVLRNHRPDVVHFHNTFLLVSPAAYHVCGEFGIPVIQTLHNYRLLCPAATFFRDGRVCEDCMGRIPWPGIAHGCWRGSRSRTVVVSAMLSAHRWMGTWNEKVNVYVALTEFAREKFVKGGLPVRKIEVKPNFVHPDPGARSGEGHYALFVGRLAPEKGLRSLLAAWDRLDGRVPLKVVGDGDLAAEVEEAGGRVRGLEWMGPRSRAEVYDLMDGAAFLLFPSEWYEGFPMVLAESFAKGLPVISSDVGSHASIVEDGRTGLHFRSGDSEDMAAKVDWAWKHPDAMGVMGLEARREYLRKYTAEEAHESLMRIYRRALSDGREAPSDGPDAISDGRADANEVSGP